MVTISIIVCTRNRCESLRRTIESLIAQDFTSADYEVIVVDNCSTDSTRAVAGAFAGKIRYVFEGRLGLSNARNRGISEAGGEIVAFIDDDAVADKSWLKGLSRVYEDNVDAGCVGGRVMLDWGVDRPSWWRDGLDEVFNGINFSKSLITLSYPNYPYGTNISFKRDVLRKVGQFKTSLGRIGSRLLAGEETELCLRIERAGFKIFYNPDAVVHHYVEPAKLSQTYIRQRALWHGRSHALIDYEYFGSAHLIRRSVNALNPLFRWVIRPINNPGSVKDLVFYMGYFIQTCLILTGRCKADRIT